MARGDIRLALDLDQNPKVRRLVRELGDGAGWCLIRLWLYVARHRPDGVLKGIARDEIEGLVGWKRGRGRFVAALEMIGFLDVADDGLMRVHEWTGHQPWISGQESRSEAARVGALAKWSKARQVSGNAKDGPADRNADSMRSGCGLDAVVHAPSPSPSPFPSPSPSPSPSPQAHTETAAVDLGRSVPPQAPAEDPPQAPAPSPSNGGAKPKTFCYRDGCEKIGTVRVQGRLYCRDHAAQVEDESLAQAFDFSSGKLPKPATEEQPQPQVEAPTIEQPSDRDSEQPTPEGGKGGEDRVVEGLTDTQMEFYRNHLPLGHQAIVRGLPIEQRGPAVDRQEYLYKKRKEVPK